MHQKARKQGFHWLLSFYLYHDCDGENGNGDDDDDGDSVWTKQIKIGFYQAVKLGAELSSSHLRSHYTAGYITLNYTFLIVSP